MSVIEHCRVERKHLYLKGEGRLPSAIDTLKHDKLASEESTPWDVCIVKYGYKVHMVVTFGTSSVIVTSGYNDV